MPELYIGLMTGTSLDGLDAILVDFTKNVSVLKCHQASLPDQYTSAIQQMRTGEADSISLLCEMDHLLANISAEAVSQLLASAGIEPDQVTAIGSHGQTIRHHVEDTPHYSLQIGDPSLIAELTGIDVVADFRRADIAAGGQGAPMMPAFHAEIFNKPGTRRCVINLGGIANVTLLPGDDSPVTGFDTGPANTLMNEWVRRHTPKTYDEDGNWARQHEADRQLLSKLLKHPYFSLPPPKSTGQETFNLGWLDQRLSSTDLEPGIVQSTLLELTVESICKALEPFAIDETLVCGGGVRNQYLMEKLHARLAGLRSTEVEGLPPDWIEAAGFAWLARQRIHNISAELASVTGAKKHKVAGGLYKS